MLFLEGVNSLQDRKKHLGIRKAPLAALTFCFHQAETRHSLGNSQAPFHRTLPLCSQRRLSPVHAGLPSGSWPSFVPCQGLEAGPAQVSRSGPETRAHLVISTASGGGVGMAPRALRKVITKVVFELTAEGSVGRQMCACSSCGSVCVPEDTAQQLHLGSAATRGKVVWALGHGGPRGAGRGTALHRRPAPLLVAGPVSPAS